MATLGAAVMFGDAMIESTRHVLKRTADVSANVVEQKSGNAAGDCVRDATDTARNVFCTLSYVTVWLRVTGVTKLVCLVDWTKTCCAAATRTEPKPRR